LPKHPHIYQNTPIYTHPHITKQVETTTVRDTQQTDLVTIQSSK